MDIPTYEQIELANPEFFNPSWGEMGRILDYQIEAEGEQVLLKLSCPCDTWPVYALDDDLRLSFVREGWHTNLH
jgi:hypothetical protein